MAIEFKVGDRIRIVRDNTGECPQSVGRIGTVVPLAPLLSNENVIVRVDDTSDLVCKCGAEHGLLEVEPGEAELVKE